MYSTPDPYEGLSSLQIVNEDENNRLGRSVKAVKSTISRVASSNSRATIKDNGRTYDEPPCPSFDLHLFAHIDRSSLNGCVFSPVPHQTTARSQSSQPISRKRPLESADSPNEQYKSAHFGHDNGELADIVYNMDIRLDELTRTCNGLRSSLHTLTKMVSQLVNNRTQSTNDLDDIAETGSPYARSISSATSKTTSDRNKRFRPGVDGVSQRPTDLLCRMIRKAYSTEEIVAGITPDGRLEKIKKTLVDRYFPDEPERFQTFWSREAHQSILGQARAQRCRDKKAGSYLGDNQNEI